MERFDLESTVLVYARCVVSVQRYKSDSAGMNTLVTPICAYGRSLHRVLQREHLDTQRQRLRGIHFNRKGNTEQHVRFHVILHAYASEIQFWETYGALSENNQTLPHSQIHIRFALVCLGMKRERDSHWNRGIFLHSP